MTRGLRIKKTIQLVGLEQIWAARKMTTCFPNHLQGGAHAELCGAVGRR